MSVMPHIVLVCGREKDRHGLSVDVVSPQSIGVVIDDPIRWFVMRCISSFSEKM